MANFVSQVLAFATILAQAGIIFLFFDWLAFRRAKHFQILVDWLGRNALLFSFLLAVAGATASLFYSEAVQLTPCPLCWLQRIFLYPQVLIFGLALRKRDERALDYGLILSLFGAAFALYQIYLQIMNQISVLCSPAGLTADCGQRYFLYFGYIDIPVMSLTAFLLLIVLALTGKFYRRDARGV